MKRLGLVGGISWVSTIDYYRLINEGINRELGGLDFADCMLYSLNFGDIYRAKWDNSYKLLLEACISLERSQVDGIVLCANTAHLFADKLKEQLTIPIISIVSATANAVKARNFTKVGLLGTAYTMEMDFYRKGLSENGITAIIQEKKETRDFIQQTLRDELGKGIIKEETRNEYLRIIAELTARGAQGILLACTEIPMLVNQSHVSVPVFDTLQIHADAAVDFAMSSTC